MAAQQISIAPKIIRALAVPVLPAHFPRYPIRPSSPLPPPLTLISLSSSTSSPNRLTSNFLLPSRRWRRRVHGDDLDGETGGGISIEIQKLGSNSRRIRSTIGIEASLDAVWNILTDYERLSDFIPGLAVSKLIEKKDNFARLYQIGQQKLPLGLKFNAKAVLDCYEKDLESSSEVNKRDIEFKMAEGDFQFFEGKWSIEQVKKQRPAKEFDSSQIRDFETTLFYSVDIKPKLWLPVHLIEGRICREIKMNLTCIKEEAQKVIHTTLHS